MSFTSTIPATSNAKKIERTTSLLLSPSKRRRIESLPDTRVETSPSKASESPCALPRTDNASVSIDATAHRPAEVWKWTLTRDAVAPCFSKDVFEMRESGVKEAEFFWLGRVPCRTVLLVGILVGVQVYEQRTIYSLDDGTAVIECLLRHPTPNTTQLVSAKARGKSSTTKPSSTCTSANSPPYKRPLSTGHPTFKSQISSPLKPVAQVGASVRIQGRVVKRGDNRVILINEIVPCKSSNDEPRHWLAVLKLHRASYFATHLGPFIIPVPAPTSCSPAKGSSCSPTKSTDTPRKNTSSVTNVRTRTTAAELGMKEPQTPSSCRSSSVDGSPSSVTSSSARSSHAESPPRLRHPLRLHTRDLTANTFRIYLKHYMDQASSVDSQSYFRSCSRSVSPSPPSRTIRTAAAIGSSLNNVRVNPADTSETPRKHKTASRIFNTPLGEEAAGERTPRPLHIRRRVDVMEGEVDRTPRRHVQPDFFHDVSLANTESNKHELDGSAQSLYGFNLSYLRRVPELAALARRVVDAEGRRRAREERKRMGADSTLGSGKAGGSTGKRDKLKEREPRTAKVKRLFRFAIRQLYEEGSIVLWDGPVRPLPAFPSEIREVSDSLWRSNIGSSTALSEGSSINQESEAEDDELSDPHPGEESYIPLTPAYFASVVEQAITDIMARTTTYGSKQKPRSKADPSALLQPPAPPPGPTSAEILAWLHRDARWARVGDWAVKEALEWAKSRERVWCIGNGRWELCE
ncbi:hypothetical protein AcW1_009511 [Taiwanofungus camphoratus]|nr:hypothetical protein AcW1_009511 [Antrodia cinnamomea]